MLRLTQLSVLKSFVRLLAIMNTFLIMRKDCDADFFRLHNRVRSVVSDTL